MSTSEYIEKPENSHHTQVTSLPKDGIIDATQLKCTDNILISNNNDASTQDNSQMVRVLDSTQPHLIFPDPPTEAKNGKFLRIATWNIRGCNADNKVTELADVAANEGIHILGLAETKLAEKVGKNKMATRRDKWVTFWTRDEKTPNGSGVGLLVDIQWSKYIQHKNTMNGRVLSLDFCFPGGAHLRVIQVYVPGSSSVPKDKRRDIEVFAVDLALSAIATGSEVIIMGDFNAVAKPAVDRLTNGSAAIGTLPEREILGRLLDNGFTDTFRARWPRTKDFTWQSSDSRNASRIDLLFCSSELTGRLTASNMALITGSDHRMMCAEFATATWVTLAGRREVEKRRVKAKRINTKRASEDQWSEFSEEVDRLLPREVDGYPTTGDQFIPWDKITVLDEAWHAAEAAFRTAAQACLPYTSTSKRGCMSRLEADSIKAIAKLGGILQGLRDFQEDRSQTNYEKITGRTMKAQAYLVSKLPSPPAVDAEEDEYLAWGRTIRAQWRNEQAKKAAMQSQQKTDNIKRCVNRRCEWTNTDMRRMLQSALDRTGERLDICRVIKSTGGRAECFDRPDDVQRMVAEHFEQWTRPRQVGQIENNPRWQQQYHPVDYVPDGAFDGLMNPPTYVEFELELTQTPRNKAPGPSGLPVELYIHASERARLFLYHIVANCVHLQDLPSKWKDSTVIPIPKSTSWDGDLNNVRPITLQEILRKVTLSILTRRLSSACATHNILRGANFSVLQGTSTTDPVHILNNVMEHAREFNKPLWVVFQDMRRAYDSVSWVSLRKAMQRIQLPGAYISLYDNIYRHRKNCVITAFGTTPAYLVGDGLDQGGVESPLHWRIFYDPLLCEIQDNAMGFRMSVEWTDNFRSGAIASCEETIQDVAYVDDTTWVASSRKHMQQTLDIAMSFYQMNDIMVNPTKTQVMVINGNQREMQSPLQFGEPPQELHINSPNEGIRILGVWLSASGSLQTHKAKMAARVDTIISIIRHKQLTDKQALFIISRVLLPALEYMITICVLSKAECQALEARYMSVLKRKAQLATSAPTSILEHHALYKFDRLHTVQARKHFLDITLRTQDEGPMGRTTWIRMAALQVYRWSARPILSHPTPESSHHSYSLLARIAALMAAESFSLDFLSKGKLPGIPLAHGTTVEEAIGNWALYTMIRKALQRHRIMFLAQIIAYDGKTLLRWEELHPLLHNHRRRRQQPQWFSCIESTLLHQAHPDSPRTLEMKWHLPGPNTFYDTISSARPHEFQEGDWVLSFPSIDRHWLAQIKQVHISSEIDRQQVEPEYCLTHWRLTNAVDDPWVPIETIDEDGGISRDNLVENFVRCEGCMAHNIDTGDCTWREPESALFAAVTEVTAYRHYTINNRYNPDPILVRTIDGRYTDINACQQALRAGATANEHGAEAVHNNNAEEKVEEIIANLRINEQVGHQVERREGNMPKRYMTGPIPQGAWPKDLTETIIAYTDGAIDRYGTTEVAGGFGWIITEGPGHGNSFAAGMQGQMSSTRAEILAVASLLDAIPEGATMTVYTDSQCTVDGYKKMKETGHILGKRKRFRINFWFEWSVIQLMITSKRLSVDMIKVLAHSGVAGNEAADALAKQGTNFPSADIAIQATEFSVMPRLHRERIVRDIRRTVSDVHRAQSSCTWKEQRRAKALLERLPPGSTDWPVTYHVIHGGNVISSMRTSISDSNRRSYRVKALQGLLPTKRDMRRRHPNLYRTECCPMCRGEVETSSHIWRCAESGCIREDILRQASEDWVYAIRQAVPDANELAVQEEANAMFKTALLTMADGQARSQMVGKPNAIEVGDVLAGITPASWVTRTARLVGGNPAARRIVAEVMDQLVLAAQILIWQPRCQAMVKWERSVGITGKDKRKAVAREKTAPERREKGVRWTDKRRALAGTCEGCGFAAEEHEADGECPVAGRAKAEGWKFYVSGLHAVRSKNYCLEGGAWAGF
jgi:exonuclease III/ribonuclease HI